MPFNPDQIRYLVVCSNKGEMYVPERNLVDMTSEGTLRDIAEGQLYDLVSVTAYNPIEHICVDMTKEVVRMAADLWAKWGEPLTARQYEFIELHIGTRAANAFERAA